MTSGPQGTAEKTGSRVGLEQEFPSISTIPIPFFLPGTSPVPLFHCGWARAGAHSAVCPECTEQLPADGACIAPVHAGGSL